MALTRLTINGKAVLELNQVAFRRDGRIEAQLPLDGTDFASINAEAGMLLKVVPGKSVQLPDAVTDALIALHYTSEKMYDKFNAGLNAWSLPVDTFYPRMGYLAVGDKFTTNCISYLKGAEASDFAADDAAAKALVAAAATTPVYGVPTTNGTIELVDTIPANTLTVLQVVKATTLPNGDYGVQFIVIRA